MIRELNQVRKGIQEGLFKAIRLVRINANEEREVLVPYSRAAYPSEANARFEFIKAELKSLPAGTYVIEAKTGNLNSSLTKSFKIIIHASLPSGGTHETHSKEEYLNPETESMSDYFDIDEYKELIKRNAQLEANEKVLLLEINLLKTQLAEKGLSEAAPAQGTLMKALEENMPVIGSIFDNYFKLQDKRMDLENRKMDLADSIPTKRKKKIRPDQSRALILDKMRDLQANDPDSFEATLDDMDEDDPELYDYVCQQLGIEFEDEEEEEEEEEEN